FRLLLDFRYGFMGVPVHPRTRAGPLLRGPAAALNPIDMGPQSRWTSLTRAEQSSAQRPGIERPATSISWSFGPTRTPTQPELRAQSMSSGLSPPNQTAGPRSIPLPTTARSTGSAAGLS